MFAFARAGGPLFCGLVILSGWAHAAQGPTEGGVPATDPIRGRGARSTAAEPVPQSYGLRRGHGPIPGRHLGQTVAPIQPPGQPVASRGQDRAAQHGGSAAGQPPEVLPAFAEQAAEFEADVVAGMPSGETGAGGAHPCSSSACPASCGPIWFRGEYLHWWTDGMALPPLVTSSPDGTPQGVAGVLGQPTTRVLFGDGNVNDDDRSGGLFTLGYQPPCRGFGIEGSYLFLACESTAFRATSAGDPVLARPFVNIEDGRQDAELMAFSDLIEGTVAVEATTKLEAAAALLRRSLRHGCRLQWDFVTGYRYGRLEDEVLITQSTLDTGGASPGATKLLADQFATSNDFHGAELGSVLTYDNCRWSIELLAKLALGGTHSKATVWGTTTVTDVENNVVTRPVGLLARSTNSGRFDRDEFAVIPQLGVTLRYAFTGHLDATFGYHFLYWSRVARAGDQIDLDLNLSDPLDGVARPEFPFQMTDFWAQGMNFGFEYRY
ncbi:MAG: hypothetical protein A2W31_05525 [Planctomycetes bacterium RBG_16_64_10]|nr:MAG: hypothetical protein A2W31_05525 [Planctomycetes bacterium RBG_16_64_10]